MLCCVVFCCVVCCYVVFMICCCKDLFMGFFEVDLISYITLVLFRTVVDLSEGLTDEIWCR